MKTHKLHAVMLVIFFLLIYPVNNISSEEYAFKEAIAMSKMISAGGGHTVGLKADGTLIGVGSNSEGELNFSNWKNIVAISAGDAHTVGLCSDGTVKATYPSSYLNYGQSDVTTWRNIVAIAAGDYHTVGIKSDGTVVATGRNLDDGLSVEEWEGIIAIDAGNSHTIGLQESGTVVGVGHSGFGELNFDQWRNIVAIAAGGWHTVGLKSDGTVLAVGLATSENGMQYYGQINVANWKDIVAISAGRFHTVGLKKDGTVIAVGDNQVGQCNVSSWKNIIAISAGTYTTVGLKADGTVVAVGYNDSGELAVSSWQNIGLSSKNSEKDYKFNVTTGEITKYIGKDAVVEIPNEIFGVEVVKIGGQAFSFCDTVKEIIIPESVEDISLTELSYKMYYGAFDECKNLQRIDVDEDNPYYKSVNGILFNRDGSELLVLPEGFDKKALIIPEGTKEIRDFAIGINKSITSVFLPKSLESFPQDSFKDISNLERIDVETNNASFSSADGILFNKNGSIIIQYPKSRRENSYTIPRGVVIIGSSAFNSCNNLTEVIIPEGVTDILGEHPFYEGAFFSCENLATLKLPRSIKKIGGGAFRNCVKLRVVELPEGISYLAPEAYANCTSIESIVIPQSLKSLGAEIGGDYGFGGVFEGCTSLKEVIILNGVEEICQHTFADCTSLKCVIVPPSVTRIGDWAFGGCSSLNRIYLGDSINDMSSSSFEECKLLQIFCKKGSYAEQYALNNRLGYITNNVEDWYLKKGSSPEVINVASVYSWATASASSYGRYLGITNPPTNINDEDLDTTWCSDFELPATCTVEFDDEYTVIWVRCAARYHTQTYSIQLSLDGVSWKTVAEHTTPDLKASGEDEGLDDYHVSLAEHKARYMRVVVTGSDAPASHIFQACIAELQALGYKGETAPTAEISLTIPNTSVGLKMMFIPSGTFIMGSPPNEQNRESDEGPQHQVTITKAFYMGAYEVTQAQWAAVMGTYPVQTGHSPSRPVTNVSWDDCQKFIQKLNTMGLGTFRLPTEAEWEYACRAGSASRFPWGNDSSYSLIDQYAWYATNSGGETKNVGQKKPNAWGLYDMHGNVWEWCSDWYGTYANAQQTNPEGPVSGSYRVKRGGCWSYDSQYCRSALRSSSKPTYMSSYLGFRLVRAL